MVAFSFNALAHTPSYGGGGSNLPPGKYKGVIVDAAKETTSSGTGGFLALTLTPIEGPLAGQKHVDRLNIHNLNPETVRIANQQMSAYCHVVGQFNIQDTAQLFNIPFFFEIDFQKGYEPGTEKGGAEGKYTEVKAIYDVNGNSPGKSQGGATPVATPVAPATPPAAVAPTAAPAAGWDGAAPATAPAAPAAPAGAPAAAWGGPPTDAAPAATPAAPAAGATALPPGWG